MALKSDGVFLTSRIPAGASVPEEQSILSKIERENTGIDGSGQVRGADKAAMNPSASSHPAKAQVAKSSWRLRTRHSLLHLPRIVDLGVFGQKKRQHAVDEPKTSNKTRRSSQQAQSRAPKPNMPPTSPSTRALPLSTIRRRLQSRLARSHLEKGRNC